MTVLPPSTRPDPTATPPRCRLPRAAPKWLAQMACLSYSPPLHFPGEEWFGKGCPTPRAEWWDGVRGQDRLLCHQLLPLIVGFWALATYKMYPHVQTCALVVSLGPEDTPWGVHTTV